MSTVEGYHEHSRGYYDERGRISCVHRRMFSTLGFPCKFNCFPMTFPHIYHDIPQCTLISPSVLTTPSVLMISLTILTISPGVLNIPRCIAYPRSTAQRLCRALLLSSSYQLSQPRLVLLKQSEIPTHHCKTYLVIA